MQAITYATFGPARDVLDLQQIPTPEPSAGEVRIRLALSGVNPSDVKARAGSRPGVTKPAFPTIIPHSDGAGVIEAVGALVDPSRIGQRVWIWNGQWQRPFGTAASHICLPEAQAVPLPDDISFETGASLGIPGMTAAHALFGGPDICDQSILIHGGGGTVGLLAVQMAAGSAARVIATCSPRDFDRVRAAGADVVLNYADPDLAAAILNANDGKTVPTIVDPEFGVNVACNAEVISPNGRIAAYGSAKDMAPTLPFGPLLFKAANIDVVLIYLLYHQERQRAIHALNVALKTGVLTCPVAQVFDLADTAAAHEAVEAGARNGAILIDCRR